MGTLEAADERLKILDHIPVGIFTINKNYTVIFWNACMEEWTGIPRSEISGADFTTYFPCFKEPRYQIRIANVLDGTAPTFFSPQLHRNILRSYLPNGEPRIQRTEVIPVRSFDGNDICSLFVVEDVTELTNRISELNKARNELQKANNDMEIRVKHRTAELATANRQLEREILEHKQTGMALLRERDRVQRYLDVAGVILIAIDRDKKLRLINKKGCEILGYSEKDVIAKDWCNDFIPEDARERVCSVISGLLNGQTEQFEYVENPVFAKNGTQRVVAWHNTVLYDEKGEIEAILSSGEDITERKQVEEAANLAYRELERTNRELKQMQSQLVQNEKLAAIGQLAAGVAHEMNTPVGFVASNFQTLDSYVKKIKGLLEAHEQLTAQIGTTPETELLEKAAATNKLRDDMKIDFILEDIQELFDDSSEGLERITNIILNLKDFSRIGRPGTREEYCLNDGIEATLVVARNEIKYDAEIKTEFSQLPFVLCNSGQINQVFLNILLNAVQAIKSQERQKNGTITIKTYTTEAEVVCEISDDGPGIPAEKLSKIFDPFFTTKPVGEGTGLGLSVSYDIIVNKHGGKLLVESTIGEGTKFIIKLPIGEAEPQNKEVMTNEEHCLNGVGAEGTV